MTRYKQLQIIKHALAYYIQRENASEKERNTEKLVLAEVESAVERLKDAYGIRPKGPAYCSVVLSKQPEEGRSFEKAEKETTE